MPEMDGQLPKSGRTPGALIAIAAILAISGCIAADIDHCSRGVRLEVPDRELREMLVTDLRSRSIEFDQKSEGVLCYEAELRDVVRQRLFELNRELNPLNRFTVAGGPYAESVLAKLREDGIEFDSVAVGSQVQITVRDQNRIQRVWEILDEASADSEW
jgi:hypothetical protein